METQAQIDRAMRELDGRSAGPESQPTSLRVRPTIAQRGQGRFAGQPLPHGSDCRAPVLEARCLGAFEVWLGGGRIQRWSSNRAKSVLRYLVTQRRAVPREALMEVLWPGWYPQQANNNLRTAIRILRQTLRGANSGGFAWIIFENGAYMVNPAVELQVDVDRFEEHWATGRSLEEQADMTAAVSQYQSAIDLYRGDYLEDDPYEDWALVQREVLKDIYLTLLGKLADYSLAGADYHACISLCQRILAKDPCREDVYQRLMSCFSRLGQRSTALRWFRVCETALKRDLDTRPGAATILLHRKVLDDERI